jgi:D-arginine dehydrogenase
MKQVDVAIIGAGIAGASIGYALRHHCSTILIEQEPLPGFHTTGRSAAFFAEAYGGVNIQPLSKASKSFLMTPPADFTQSTLLKQRGVLYISTQQKQASIDAMWRDFLPLLPLRKVYGAEIAELAPMVAAPWQSTGIYDESCKDIDVAALHAGYLRGQDVLVDAQVLALERKGNCWQLKTRDSEIRAGIVVNAAGAWGDNIAILAGADPVGLRPCKRTIVTFAPLNFTVDSAWPLVMDIDEGFYFKPEGGLIWASPADETPELPGDVQPDELDIALTMERITGATLFEVASLKRSWAGLRTFAPDRLPVYGFDDRVPNFYWCVGQGGWGIQTSPAASRLCAAQILGTALPHALAEAGVMPELYAPGRFGQSGDFAM